MRLGTPPATILTPPATQLLSFVSLPGVSAATLAASDGSSYQPPLPPQLGVPVTFFTPASSSQSVPLAAGGVSLRNPGQVPLCELGVSDRLARARAQARQLATSRAIKGSAEAQRMREPVSFMQPEVCEMLQLSPRLRAMLPGSARLAQGPGQTVEGADWVSSAAMMAGTAPHKDTSDFGAEVEMHSDLPELVPTAPADGSPQMLPSADYAIVSPSVTLPASAALPPMKLSEWAEPVTAPNVYAEVATYSDGVAQRPTIQGGAVPQTFSSSVAQSAALQGVSVPQVPPSSAIDVQFYSSINSTGSPVGAFGGSFGFRELQANLSAPVPAGMPVPADMPLDPVSPPSTSSLVQDLQELKAMIGGLKVANPYEQVSSPFVQQDANTASTAVRRPSINGAWPLGPSAVAPSVAARPPTSIGIATGDVGAWSTGSWRHVVTPQMPGTTDAISVAFSSGANYSSGAWRSNGSAAYNVMEVPRAAERPITEYYQQQHQSYQLPVQRAAGEWQSIQGVPTNVLPIPDPEPVSVNRSIYERYHQQESQGMFNAGARGRNDRPERPSEMFAPQPRLYPD